ncbi:LodA/GoxA family CTQ-dependent oxidase [Chromobacterium haemolyticum]|uniref:LodA/GoxA family CTQ-dependent oxidase n=1 Tax=Chromobacterium haemolyticum TaxID=394935 RepID=A0ABS3GTU0_9NEIS|nr:LodA/GoxA family CTQ-dependent oxidase [Chromobacterium haemolyticum]MBK0417219.1 LodA/GoxA family CTQ-dependent oxidase [Chromobacterium haemolyticum]MBO0418344.1 LodA/GoxA family CTQ-dependent oxidase [Chromobacterium haemolyticum]MBO0501669.1 LodA/GoxA family CTQ-dependent oxidase [Chromobacterium haemolyticum]
MSTTTPVQPSDTVIVKAGIYPAIGIARVGNSPEAFYFGPEVPDPAPAAPGFYRDESGALKREAARFRIYGFNAADEVVAELNADNADIQWAVTLANTKAAWYQFQIALDIPEAATAPPSFLRNMAIADRAVLSIAPGERQISGRDQQGSTYVFGSGRFMGKEVYLGELRTDTQGRLFVLGGHGKSASYNGAQAITFANNEGWHDDVADGPVTANVQYQGKDIPVDPAWVVVAPPNYAPQQKSVRTMWDLMRDLFVSEGTLSAPTKPSFQNDIRPIFERLSHLQWVNAGFAASFGWGGSLPFSQPDWMKKLANPSDNLKEWRLTLFNQFRQFKRDAWAPSPWPWLYGDAMSVPPAETPRQNVELTELQLRFLRQWADGGFVADYAPDTIPPQRIEDVLLAAQPNTLNQAAMEFCLADAFHPGCEMTWPMRQASMYMAPFRLAHRPKSWIEPDYGAVLTPDNISGPCGPQIAGGITRWMAVPWQTDTASCRSGYQKSYDPYLPTFWPARVPNQVMSQQAYETVMDESAPQDDRLSAFAKRAAWIRPLGNISYQDQINNMIQDIAQMGIVEVRKGPRDGAGFPSTLQVEQLPPPHGERLLAAEALQEEFEDVDLSTVEKVRHLGPRRKS